MTPPELSRRGAQRLMLGALAGLLPGGCALLPDAVPAIDSGPNRFREAAPGAPVRWPDPNWWRAYGSVELERFMRRMAESNLDLAAAEARVRQADASARITGAALLPQVTGGGTAQRQQQGGGARAVTAYTAQLSASYEVDFWGRNRNAYLSSRLAASVSRYNLGTVLLTTEASVANTYFAILQAREALTIQEANLGAARRVLNVIQQQVTGGTATGLDLAQQETLVSQQQAAIPPLRQTVSQNVASLAVLLGVAPVELDVLAPGFDGLEVPSPAAGLPSELLTRRPDVLAAEASLAAGNANVAVARAALLPSITLSAQGGFSSLLVGTLLRPEAQFLSLVAGLTQPIFDGGALRAQVDLTRAQQEELLIAYRRAILEALADVETTLAALRETTEQVGLLQEAETRASRAYNIAEAQLRGGVVNLITVLQTQQTLFTARRNLSTARLNLFQSSVGLFRALGGGWGGTSAVLAAAGPEAAR